MLISHRAKLSYSDNRLYAVQFINEPCRMALIDSSMFGIPFEGYDYYQNGTGGMKGVIAKAITLSTRQVQIWIKRVWRPFLQKVYLPLLFYYNNISL